MDYEHVEHGRLLFEAGGDPNEGALLVHAVSSGVPHSPAPALEVGAVAGQEPQRPG